MGRRRRCADVAAAAAPDAVLRHLVYRYAGADRPAVDDDARPASWRDGCTGRPQRIGEDHADEPDPCGLWHPEGGEIRLDDVPSPNAPPTGCAATSRWCPGPLPVPRYDRRELRVAKPDATEAELVEACRAANLLRRSSACRALRHDRRRTRAALSGGQVQRLAIARQSSRMRRSSCSTSRPRRSTSRPRRDPGGARAPRARPRGAADRAPPRPSSTPTGSS